MTHSCSWTPGRRRGALKRVIIPEFTLINRSIGSVAKSYPDLTPDLHGRVSLPSASPLYTLICDTHTPELCVCVCVCSSGPVALCEYVFHPSALAHVRVCEIKLKCTFGGGWSCRLPHKPVRVVHVTEF